MLQNKTKQKDMSDLETEAALAQAMAKRGYGKSGGLFPFTGYLEIEDFPQTEIKKISFYTQGQVISGYILGIENVPMDSDLLNLFQSMFSGKAKE